MVVEEAIPFDRKTAPAVMVDGILCLFYLEDKKYDEGIDKLARQLDPEGAIIICNLNGAKHIIADLMDKWQELGKDLNSTIVSEIKFKSSNTQGSSGHVDRIKAVDSNLVKGRKVIVVDDVGDTTLTMKAIVEDLQAAGCDSIVTAVFDLKEEHDRQERFDYDYYVYIVKNEWLGGHNSMDFETDDVPVDFPRGIKALVVKINPEDEWRVWYEIAHGLRQVFIYQPNFSIS